MKDIALLILKEFPEANVAVSVQLMCPDSGGWVAFAPGGKPWGKDSTIQPKLEEAVPRWWITVKYNGTEYADHQGAEVDLSSALYLILGLMRARRMIK